MPTPRNLNFDDLNFQPISPDSRTSKAVLTFKNHYGCIVYHRSEATNRELPYEFHLLYNNSPAANSNISDGPVGYCSKNDICEFIRIAQSLCAAPRS